jgi:hypothetical protein
MTFGRIAQKRYKRLKAQNDDGGLVYDLFLHDKAHISLLSKLILVYFPDNSFTMRQSRLRQTKQKGKRPRRELH